MSIAQKLIDINDAKLDIRDALVENHASALTGSLSATCPLSAYGDAVREVGKYNEWVRPDDWLPMPSAGANEEVCYILMAVWPNNERNYVTIYSGEDYTVNWGDGITSGYSGWTVAEHQYDYNDVALSGTECSRGYKQALITVTAQPTKVLYTMQMSNVPSEKKSGYVISPLDILWSLPNQTTGQVRIGYTNTRPHYLERFELRYAVPPDMSYMFAYCNSLRKINSFDTSTSTNFQVCFYSCSHLEYIPDDLLDMSSITSDWGVNNMFGFCSNLRKVPNGFDTTGRVYMANLFNACTSLEEVPWFDTSSAVTVEAMFSGCAQLKSIPDLDTSNVTNFKNFLYGTRALSGIPDLDTSSATSMYGFVNASGVRILPDLDTSSVTDFTNFHAWAYGLEEIGSMPVSAGTLFTNFMAGNSQLVRCQAYGFVQNIDFTNTQLGRDALVEIFEGLGTASKTITITNCPGADDLSVDDRAIATDKGWTIVG